jgi:ABC-type antimicrobial peptide transport system ATPase subunit
MYFPTLDQLLLDATLGAMSTEIDAVLAGITESDPRIRLELMFRAIGLEAFVVLYDIRGLDAEQAQRVALATALSLIDAAVAAARADAGQERPGAP